MERNLRFELTCEESPEQYDVYDEEGYQVGYVRLRYGNLSVSCPCCDIGNEILDWGTNGYGCFSDDAERSIGMNIISAAINHWLDYQYPLQLNVPYVVFTVDKLARISVPFRIFKNDGTNTYNKGFKNVKMVECRSGFNDSRRYMSSLYQLTSYTTNRGYVIMSFDEARKNMEHHHRIFHSSEEAVSPLILDYHSERNIELISHVPYVITAENYVKWYDLYVTTNIINGEIVEIPHENEKDKFTSIKLSTLFPESLDDIEYLDHSWMPKSVVKFAIKHNMQIGRMAFNAIVLMYYETAKYIPESNDDIDYEFLNKILPTKEDYEKVIVEDYGTTNRVDDMNVWANICMPVYIGDEPNPLLPVPVH